MTGKRKFTASDIVEALDQHKGMVYLAAKALGCSHQTIYNYAKRYATVQEAIDRNRGQVVDTAELALYGAILREEHWAIAFTLKTLGKNRGYVDRQEHRTENLNIDMSALTDDQLRRIADGEDPIYVLSASG